MADRSLWEISVSDRYPCFGDESLQNGWFAFSDIYAEDLNMKSDCGLYISEGFFVGITFAYQDAFEAERIGNLPIQVFFHDNFELLMHGCLLAQSVQDDSTKRSVSDDMAPQHLNIHSVARIRD